MDTNPIYKSEPMAVTLNYCFVCFKKTIEYFEKKEICYC